MNLLKNFFFSGNIAEFAILVSVSSLLLSMLFYFLTTLFRKFSAPARSTVCNASIIFLIIMPFIAGLFYFGNISLLKVSTKTTNFKDNESFEEILLPPGEVLKRNVFRVLEQPQFAEEEIQTGQTAPVSSVEEKEPDDTLSKKEMIVSGINVFAAIWLAGTLLMLLRIAHGWVFLLGFRVALKRIEDKKIYEIFDSFPEKKYFRSLPRFYSCEIIDSPFAFGIFYPTIVLPSQLYKKMNNIELKVILFHEFAHLVRKDHVVGFLQRLAQAIFWWNPFVAKINEAIGKAEEEVCDNYVINKACDIATYAECLLNLAERTVKVHKLPSTVGFSHPKQSLKERIANLFNTERLIEMKTNRKFIFMVFASYVLIALGFMTLCPHASLYAAESGETEAKYLPKDLKLLDEKPVMSKSYTGFVDKNGNNITKDSFPADVMKKLKENDIIRAPIPANLIEKIKKENMPVPSVHNLYAGKLIFPTNEKSFEKLFLTTSLKNGGYGFGGNIDNVIYGHYGKYYKSILINKPGYRSIEIKFPSLKTPSDKQTKIWLGYIKMIPLPRAEFSNSISGVLTMDADKPLLVNGTAKLRVGYSHVIADSAIIRDGKFHFNDIPPGKYYITFSLDADYAVHSKEISIKNGKEQKMEVSLKAYPKYEITLLTYPINKIGQSPLRIETIKCGDAFGKETSTRLYPMSRLQLRQEGDKVEFSVLTKSGNIPRGVKFKDLPTFIIFCKKAYKDTQGLFELMKSKKFTNAASCWVKPQKGDVFLIGSMNQKVKYISIIKDVKKATEK